MRTTTGAEENLVQERKQEARGKPRRGTAY
jgi:hypothetical protein